MAKALADLRVVDLSDNVAGQYCGRLFADFGAETMLCESAAGSPTRLLPPFSMTDHDLSLTFWHLNTGKRSLVLDLETEDGRDQLETVIQTADVVILPASDELAAAAGPLENCISVAVTPFGRNGPFSGWKGPEIVLQAQSGMMNNNGEYGREPLYGVGERASYAAGLGAFIGALAALRVRDRTGVVQAVEVDAAETAASMCFPYVLRHNYNGSIHSRRDYTIPAGQVRCSDGWICIWIYNHRWHALCEALDLLHLEHDPRFAEPAERRSNWNALYELIQEKVRDQVAEDVVDRLQAAQIIAAKAYRPSEQIANGHLAMRGYWESVDGRTVLGPPFRMSLTPREVDFGAPTLASFTPSPRNRTQQLAKDKGGIAQRQPPLDGLRVIEITTAWAGPMAGRVLGFLGAECIHVESPNRVNSWRLNKERPNPVNFPGGVPGDRPFDRSFLFNSQNVNKLSCILNLKTEEGREALRNLVAVADVVICNFRPGTLTKLGLGYDSLAAIKPDIIVAELPAFGLNGPLAGYAALGPTMEMATGMSAMTGYPGGPPENTGPSYLDPIGGFNAAAAILIALHYRERTGLGQHIEVPQVEAAMQLIGPDLLHAAEADTDPVPDGNRVATASPHDAFPAKGEDQWVVIAAENEGQWRALCQAMNSPAIADDPRFRTLADRKANEHDLTRIVSEWTKTRDKHEVALLLQASGVASAAVANAADLAASSYLAARGFFTHLDHPDAGQHPHPGLPIHLSATPGSQRSAAPRFGEHNLRVLTEILRLPPEEVDRVSAAAMATVPFTDG